MNDPISQGQRLGWASVQLSENQTGGCVSYPDIWRQVVWQAQSHSLTSLALGGWGPDLDKEQSLGLVGDDQGGGQ